MLHIRHCVSDTSRPLTHLILWVGHRQREGSEEDDVHEVEKQVGKVEPGSEPVPLVVQQARHQGMLQ